MARLAQLFADRNQVPRDPGAPPAVQQDGEVPEDQAAQEDLPPPQEEVVETPVRPRNFVAAPSPAPSIRSPNMNP